MAPEVFRHEPYNKAVDVYSFALITYWLMSGVKPFPHILNATDAATRAVPDG